MSDTAELSESPKLFKPVNKVGRPRKPRGDNWHPKISVMVEAAISSLKERRGSSYPAIKKYIAANYKVDMIRLNPFIKKYLKTSVANGSLLQSKGKGASGSFKLITAKPVSGKIEKSVKVVVKKVAAAKVSKTKKAVPKKRKAKPVKAVKKGKTVKSLRKPKSKSVVKPKPKKVTKRPTKKTPSKKGKK